MLVIGAGVCGLSSAICLAEAGLNVTIRAARAPLETTSVAAGAIWGPHLVEDSERVTRWSRQSLAILTDLAGQHGTGVRIMRGTEAARIQGEPPGWAATLPGFRRCGPAELPDGFVTGWQYRAPVLAMPAYLGYLLDRLDAAGGELEMAAVGSLAEAAAAARVVVNCPGVEAHGLVPDPAMRPVRGQVVVVPNPGLTDFFIGPAEGGGGFVYMFPHADVVLLGGTEQHDNWDTEPDPETSRRILAGCAAVEPRLAGAEILAERVGLRPFRPEVRLEAEPVAGGGLLVHNYGHGGAGVTLSWGCAREITDQITAFVTR